MALNAAFAPTLPFERLTAGYGSPYAPLASLRAIPELDPPAPAPDMRFDGADAVTFTQSGNVYVQRGANLRAMDRVTYQGRKYLLMGAKNWDLTHPSTGRDLQWMVFGLRVDPDQLIADILAAHGQPIALIPAEGTVVPKPSGGKDYLPGAPRPAQLFAKFNTQALDGIERAQTDRGTTRKFQFEIIGARGAVVLIGDHWEDGAAKYVVNTVDNTQPHQVRAVATGFLKTAGHGFGG